MASLLDRLHRALLKGYGGRSNMRLFLDVARRDPGWALMYLSGRFELVRRLATRTPRSPLPIPDDAESLFPELDVEQAVRALREDGIVPGLDIGRQQLTAILEHLDASSCFVDPDPDHVFHVRDRAAAERDSGKSFIRAGYFKEDIACDPIRRVANDPKLLAIASRYLGAASPIAEGQIYWNFRPEVDYDLRDIAQAFHYDIEDYRGIRLFIYLTDVDAAAGPHVFIRGSHRVKKLHHRLPFGYAQLEEQLIAQYGQENVQTILGRAGAAFLEDPFGYHKGTRPTGKDRLLLAIVYKRRHYRLDKEAHLSALPNEATATAAEAS